MGALNHLRRGVSELNLSAVKGHLIIVVAMPTRCVESDPGLIILGRFKRVVGCCLGSLGLLEGYLFKIGGALYRAMHQVFVEILLLFRILCCLEFLTILSRNLLGIVTLFA